MARYVTYTNTSSELLFISEEHSLYGSARIGVDGRKDTLYKAGAYTLAWCGTQSARRELGQKQYELTNHLGNVLVSISDKKAYKTLSGSICFEAEIITLSDYYPFGSAMQTRGFAVEAYRFGFNTQEKDTEIGSDIYTAQFWEYDGRLGRRWNVDPVDQIRLSNYSVNGGNPLVFNDPSGAKFGKGKEQVEAYKNEVTTRRDLYTGRQEDLQKRLDSRISKQQARNEHYDKENDQRVKDLSRQIELQQQCQNKLSEVLCELDVLEKSSWIYDISFVNSPNWNIGGTGGEIWHSLVDNHIKVDLNISWNFLKVISHELKHAYQFEEGKIGFFGDIGSFGDLQDEAEAFIRSQLFGFYPKEEITTSWVLGEGYKLGHNQLTIYSKEGATPGAGYWELYYYEQGREGTKPDNLIIVNLPNWAEIYMNGVNSCSIK